MVTDSSLTQQLDELWFDRFRKLGSFSSYEFLGSDLISIKAEKNKFLSGSVINPTFYYPKIKIDNVENSLHELEKLHEDVLSHEKNMIVKDTYLERIEEKKMELYLLKAARDSDMHKFKFYVEKVYGKPDKIIFKYTINKINEILSEYNSLTNVPSLQTFKYLFPVLAAYSTPSKKVIPLPSEEKILFAQNETIKDIGFLIAKSLKKKIYEAEDIKKTFDEALDMLQAQDWSVVIDTSGKTWMSVNHVKKQVKIPVTRILTKEEIPIFIAHEIGTHVVRRLNGEKSKLKLLGIGLDRWERGEEGIATMREQALLGEVEDFARTARYFAISLAYGLDGTPRDFRGVYNVLKEYFMVKSLIYKNDIELADIFSTDKAWEVCVRTFRGTNNKTAGVCYTKDIIYREGNILIWNVINNSPKELKRFSRGKYDPANQKHIRILDELGIE